MGYHRAGFEVVGVDINPQPRYPFEFYEADALDFPLDGFDAIHASPPCQAYSVASRYTGKIYPDLVAATRVRLEASGLPWVIENVPDAPLRADLILCGCMFGLTRLRRKRLFETSWRAYVLHRPCQHTERAVTVVGTGTPTRTRDAFGGCPTIADWRAVMGIDWMTRAELSQAIPPAYTSFVGEQLLAHLGLEVAA
jgi:DNA (cytosine-5)-methyltransferase 1